LLLHNVQPCTENISCVVVCGVCCEQSGSGAVFTECFSFILPVAVKLWCKLKAKTLSVLTCFILVIFSTVVCVLQVIGSNVYDKEKLVNCCVAT
jgi:hypothetical protein